MSSFRYVPGGARASGRGSRPDARGPRDHEQCRPGESRERLTLLAGACGLFVGKGGCNIKELQQSEGVRHINVDFNASAVVVVGTAAAIEKVRRRVAKASSVAANSKTYFPEKAATFVDVAAAHVRFVGVGPAAELPVVLGALDPSREYFALTKANAAPGASRADALRGAMTGLHVGGAEHLIVGFNADAALRLFEDATTRGLDGLAKPGVTARFAVHFGKTLLSSVPTEARDRALAAAELADIPFCKGGIRPEFNRLLEPGARARLLARLAGRYEELSSTKKIRVDCWREDTFVRHTITMLDAAETVDDGAADGAVRAVAAAKTLYAVLAVAPGALVRDVKVAYRKAALAVHPDKNAHPAAADAMKVVNEAFECLKAGGCPEGARAPRTRVALTEAAAPRCRMPAVESCRSPHRKLGLVTVLRGAAEAEFRAALKLERDFGNVLDVETRRLLEAAWVGSANDRLAFADGTALKVDAVRSVLSTTLTDGTFALRLDDSSDDVFGQATAGVALSLSSYALDDALAALKAAAANGNAADGHAAAVSRVMADVRDLLTEAARIADLCAP